MKWFVEVLTHVNTRHEVEADTLDEAWTKATSEATVRAINADYRAEEIALVEPILGSTHPESGHTALLPE